MVGCQAAIASLLAMNDNAVYAGSTLSSARFTASSASMMTCWIANAVWRCGPIRSLAKSLARTLAVANDS